MKYETILYFKNLSENVKVKM